MNNRVEVMTLQGLTQITSPEHHAKLQQLRHMIVLKTTAEDGLLRPSTVLQSAEYSQSVQGANAGRRVPDGNAVVIER